jgi:hypothetical protein
MTRSTHKLRERSTVLPFVPMRRLAAAGLILAVLAVSSAWASSPADTDYLLPSGDRVPGVRLSDLDVLRAQADRVRQAVQVRWGADIGRIPVHIVSLDQIRTLHAEVGGRLPSGWQLHGFELDGHVFVRRGLGGVSDEVLIHECLHGLSRRFTDEAHARGVGRLVEGITQFFTLAALAARPPTPGLRAERNHTYVGSTELAETLATLVGEKALAAAYLEGGFDALAGRVDALTHGRRRLVHAATLLDQGDEPAALRALTGTAQK